MTLQTHPTVNPGAGDILQLIKKKKVTPKPGILCYNDNTVTFLDGTSEEVDAVVCATGIGNFDCPAPRGQDTRVQVRCRVCPIDDTLSVTCHACCCKHTSTLENDLI